MSFTNVYYKRTTATPKPCYICYRPTTTVLATINTTDFLYTCDTHLTDPGFASPLGDSNAGVAAGGAKKMGLSDEEIAKIKEEWEESQKRKKEKEKEKEKEKSDTAKKENESKDPPKTEKKSPAPSLPSPPTPTHQRYSLHRDIFAMRLTEHRKRRQVTQAKEVAPRLPGAPRGGLS